MTYLTKGFYDRADLRSVIFVLAALALMGVQWSDALRHPVVYLAGLIFAFLACVIDHNHQHRATFLAPGLNRVFGVLLTWAIGQPASAVVPMHLANHHVHNNHDEDFVRTSIVGFRWNWLNLLLFPFVAIRGYARVKKRNLKAWAEAQPRLYQQLVLERWTLYPLALALLAVAPRETLAYVIGPWLFGQWGIIAVNYVQHDGCDPDNKYNHTRNFTGRWLNWWTFNNGYHTAHHLRPSLHWSRLPALHAELAARLDPCLQERSLATTLIRLYLWPGRRPVFYEGQS